MVTVFMNKNGYTMVELLLLIAILGIINLISIGNMKNLDMSHYYFMNAYLNKQSSSIRNYQKENGDDDIYFNSMGRVNKAKTVHFDKHKVIIHLGNGYITYE